MRTGNRLWPGMRQAWTGLTTPCNRHGARLVLVGVGDVLPRHRHPDRFEPVQHPHGLRVVRQDLREPLVGVGRFVRPRAAELDATVDGLARSLRAKNPMALRLSKELYLHGKDMGWDAALNFANAKVRELTALSDGEWIDRGIPSFLRGEFRPGLGGVGADDPDDPGEGSGTA